MGNRDTQVRIIVYSFFTLGVFTLLPMLPSTESVLEPRPKIPNTAMSAVVTSPFLYTFNSTSTLKEAGRMADSTSPYWWVNSGAKMLISGGMGMTVQGELPLTDPFRLLYAAMNPLDTEFGKYPQNTFRLITRSTWNNARLQASFRIAKDNLTASPNRNTSNGLLFMSRYVDSQTLYYAGVRVDGAAVIKKKYKGTYYTMAYKKIFDGSYSSTSPNLLPHGEWLGLRSETVTNADGGVSIRLFVQREGGAWTLVLFAKDDGRAFGGTPPILGPQYVGIRTDFMDVQFKAYRTENITP